MNQQTERALHHSFGIRMIQDVKFWQEWEANGPLREPADFHRNLRLLQGMYDLARAVGAFPPADPLEGLETDLRVARILNRMNQT